MVTLLITYLALKQASHWPIRSELNPRTYSNIVYIRKVGPKVSPKSRFGSHIEVAKQPAEPTFRYVIKTLHTVIVCNSGILTMPWQFEFTSGKSSVSSSYLSIVQPLTYLQTSM